MYKILGTMTIMILLISGCSATPSKVQRNRIKVVNIASQSDLDPKFYDGAIKNACVAHSDIGLGWNPGELITLNFKEKKPINYVGLYLGESEPHEEEVGSGYIEAKIDGSYKIVATFSNYGYKTHKFIINLNRTIITDSLKMYMTSGGGSDKNLCVNEIRIYSKIN